MQVKLQQRFSAMRRIMLRCVGAGIASLFMAPLALGFGAEAHRTAGHIAERFICPETRQALMAIMPQYSLAEAGIWADRIRSNPDWDIARPWHYLNIPDDVRLSVAPRRASGDVLTAIERFYLELGDVQLDDEARLEAFYFVVHFTVDIHQPLHVGRRDDLGGNRVDVVVDGKRTNLHAYWDTYIFEPVLKNPVGYGARLAGRYARFAAIWQQSDPSIWAIESQAFRPQVYGFGTWDEDGRALLDELYRKQSLQIAEFRVAQAGIRLAGLLNSIWCPAAEGA